jgi:Secretion system C-terminal sorting domain
MKNLFISIVFFLINLGKTQAQLFNSEQITVENGAILTINSDFVNHGNGKFTNNGTVNIKGNITNNQIMTVPNLGQWNFIGTINQHVLGASPLLTYNLNFNNAAGFTLENSAKIANFGSFTSGIIDANDPTFPLIFGQNSGINLVATDASHVNGYVVKEGGDTFIFPVGDATKYQPITAEFEFNDKGLMAKYNPNDAGAGVYTNSGMEATLLNNYNNKEYWDLKPYNSGNTSAYITVYWDGYKDSYLDAAGLRRVAHKVGEKWQNEGFAANTSGSAANGAVKSGQIDSWSPFALGFVAAAPLPLTLLDFSLKNTKKGIQLNWKTSHEINFSHFEIERSEDAKKFEKIGEKTGNASENYEFLDSTPPPVAGGLYYRLKMLDFDGKYTYSKVLSIKNESLQNGNIRVYPNPVSNVLYVENMKTNVAEISNVLGQTVKYNLLKSSDLQSTINVSALPKGLYFIKIDGQVNKFWKE